MTFELIKTRDGAVVVRDTNSGELMHPTGPTTEARVLYIEPSRLRARLVEGPVTLFDVGLGAGTNAIAAWRMAAEVGAAAQLDIVSFDQTTDALALALANPSDFDFGDAAEVARTIVDRGSAIGPHGSWRYIEGDLPNTLTQAERRADIVLWDMYSAKTNPTLWGVAAFRSLYEVVAPTATLHTYGASTAARAALILAGFYVGRGPGVGQKAETTAAAMRIEDLDAPLDRRWYERFQRSSAALPADAPADAHERVAAYFDA